MKKLALIILLLAALPRICSAQAYSTEQMEVMMSMISLKDALIASDSIKLSGLLSEDVSYGHTNGLIQTKAQLTRSVMSKEQDYKSIDPSEMNVRIYEHTGVVTMKAKIILNYHEQTLDLNMFITLVWIKQANNWKLVARQAVKL